MISALSIEHHEKTVKMLTAIMAVFALFWLPGQIMAFLLEFENENEFILTYGLDIGYLFVFTNCVLNPFIFAYYSQRHRHFSNHRKLTTSSLNPTIACELGNSTFRRDSERSGSITQQRRGSLPGNLKRIPLAKSIKRPSLPAILKSEKLTEAQRKDLLQEGRKKTLTTSKRKNSILPQKQQLPVVDEVKNSDIISSSQNESLPFKIEMDAQQANSPNEAIKSDTLTLIQHDKTPHNSENSGPVPKRGSIPGPEKRLSFSLQRQEISPSKQSNNSYIVTRKQQSNTQKRLSFSILKKRDSFLELQRDQFRGTSSGDTDSGNWVMRNFLEIMKTMREDMLRKYLEATPETALN